jgi:hypothetical protein
VRQEKSMIRFIRRLSVPASESQLGIGLSLAAVAMALMLWAIVWQSNIIGYQRNLIDLLWSGKFGS